jgi:hypothetical protein
LVGCVTQNRIIHRQYNTGGVCILLIEIIHRQKIQVYASHRINNIQTVQYTGICVTQNRNNGQKENTGVCVTQNRNNTHTG